MTKGGGGRCPFASRRGFLAGAAGLVAASGGATAPADAARAHASDTEPFWGPRQGGIVTRQQAHTVFAAFDVIAKRSAEVAALLRRWTDAAALLSHGETIADDGGDVAGLSPARLTITFGIGPGLFRSDGQDRFGLAARCPEALRDLPPFNGDQLIAQQCGGALSVQACADDPQVALHAVRQLNRLAYGSARLRWLQSGFVSARAGETPRNLMGFKDGTRNPTPGADGRIDRAIWAGDEAPEWLRGGSFVVVRRIRVALEHWDRMPIDDQEQVVGRRKRSGAPLTGAGEFDAPDFAAADGDGNPAIPEAAHIRLGAPETNAGARMLRRGYSYSNGSAQIAERWPPWRQGQMLDAGLLFIAYQRDPRDGFIKVYEPMSMLDALNQFTTHIGSALFACPPGAAPGEFIGQALFDG